MLRAKVVKPFLLHTKRILFLTSTTAHSHHLDAINSPTTLIGAGHQRTVSTITGYKQWFSLTKSTLNVTLVGRNRSLMARTSKCGWAISSMKQRMGRTGCYLQMNRLKFIKTSGKLPNIDKESREYTSN